MKMSANNYVKLRRNKVGAVEISVCDADTGYELSDKKMIGKDWFGQLKEYQKEHSTEYGFILVDDFEKVTK